MKIGLLTFNQTANIGTLAQSYCAFKLLQACHPNAEIKIIDYEPWSRIKFRLREALPAISAKNTSINLNSYFKQRAARKFLKKYCKLEDCGIFHGLFRSDKVISRKEFNIIYTGSDTVWMYHPSRLPRIPSLYFLPETLGHTERRAIAVSIDPCLSSSHEFVANQKAISSALAAFSKISVRDNRTEEFVCRFGEAKGYIKTLDPTLLHDFENDFGIHYSKASNLSSKPRVMIWAEKSDADRLESALTSCSVTKGQGLSHWSQNPIVNEIDNMLKYDAIITDRFHRAILTIKTSGRCVVAVEGSKKYPERGSKCRDLFDSIGMSDYVIRGDTLRNSDGRHVSCLLHEWTKDRAAGRREKLFELITESKSEFLKYYKIRREGLLNG